MASYQADVNKTNFRGPALVIQEQAGPLNGIGRTRALAIEALLEQGHPRVLHLTHLNIEITLLTSTYILNIHVGRSVGAVFIYWDHAKYHDSTYAPLTIFQAVSQTTRRTVCTCLANLSHLLLQQVDILLLQNIS